MRSLHTRSVKVLLVLLAVAALLLTLLFNPSFHSQASRDGEVRSERVLADLNFLAQPALQGRQPSSAGSQKARNYITKQFARCGLLPWKGAAGLEQSVVLGTNIVGVLPGADLRLAKEIVVVSAHYDHLGGACLGACDNASGVSALLEIARVLSSAPEKPRRSVCFAAFDCEEQGLFGSVAFTCRDDFDPDEIVGVVNLDMLGRAFVGSIEEHLCVAGTRAFPEIRERIGAAAAKRGVSVLSFERDPFSLQGDHLTFAFLGIPSVGLSCGYFPGYHSPADTAERIDPRALHDATEIARDTVSFLASTAEKSRSAPVKEACPEEIASMQRVIQALLQGDSAAVRTQDDRRRLEALREAGTRLASGQGRSENEADEWFREVMRVCARTITDRRIDFPSTRLTVGFELYDGEGKHTLWGPEWFKEYRALVKDTLAYADIGT